MATFWRDEDVKFKDGDVIWVFPYVMVLIDVIYLQSHLSLEIDKDSEITSQISKKSLMITGIDLDSKLYV